MEYDAGLMFVCYQRDPRTGFIKIFDGMSKLDMMNQFVTHVGGGLFACPGGVQKGQFHRTAIVRPVAEIQPYPQSIGKTRRIFARTKFS